MRLTPTWKTRGSAGLNSFAFDFVARQKVQGQHLNWFVVEQLPAIASGDYDRRFGEMTARELVRDHVLRLTYTAHDMPPFPATSAMAARRSSGTKRSAATCAPGSTRSTSTSTA